MGTAWHDTAGQGTARLRCPPEISFSLLLGQGRGCEGSAMMPSPCNASLPAALPLHPPPSPSIPPPCPKSATLLPISVPSTCASSGCRWEQGRDPGHPKSRPQRALPGARDQWGQGAASSTCVWRWGGDTVPRCASEQGGGPVGPVPPSPSCWEDPQAFVPWAECLPWASRGFCRGPVGGPWGGLWGV